MIEMLCAALLMRAIQHLPRPFRLDSDGTTYAWYDLACITGYEDWDGYLADPLTCDCPGTECTYYGSVS